MKVFALDPGATTGWVIYDTEARRAIESGCFPGSEWPKQLMALCWGADVRVIERPMGYGATRPQVVDCAWVAGILTGSMRQGGLEVHEMKRHEIKVILSDATLRDIVVKNDATAWAAILMLHGGEQAAKKGGPLHGVKSHGRAALAAAVAWDLMSRERAVRPG